MSSDRFSRQHLHHSSLGILQSFKNDNSNPASATQSFRSPPGNAFRSTTNIFKSFLAPNSSTSKVKPQHNQHHFVVDNDETNINPSSLPVYAVSRNDVLTSGEDNLSAINKTLMPAQVLLLPDVNKRKSAEITVSNQLTQFSQPPITQQQQNEYRKIPEFTSLQLSEPDVAVNTNKNDANSRKLFLNDVNKLCQISSDSTVHDAPEDGRGDCRYQRKTKTIIHDKTQLSPLVESLIDDLNNLATSQSSAAQEQPLYQWSFPRNSPILPFGGHEVKSGKIPLVNQDTNECSQNGFTDISMHLSRPMQRKLLNLMKCKLVYCPEARLRLVKALRLIAERALTDLLIMYQNPVCLTKNLWIAVRNRGCQFLGPAMQEEVLRLIILALEDGSSLSRKVLVLFVVQKLLSRYPRASKTNVGHVVQLLYRASCFKLQKREDDSSLMQLKEEFRNYDALRREHDAQIIQIAMDACLKISPESWSSLLYGDNEHRSQMQSIIDRLQMNQPQNFSGTLRELQNALQRSGDPHELGKLLADIDYIDRHTRDVTTGSALLDESESDQNYDISIEHYEHTYADNLFGSEGTLNSARLTIENDALLVDIMMKIKNLVIACARVSISTRYRPPPQTSLSPSLKHKQYYSTLNLREDSNAVGDDIDVKGSPLGCQRGVPYPKSSLKNYDANLYRTWSSMSSLMPELYSNSPKLTRRFDSNHMGSIGINQTNDRIPPSVMVTSAVDNELDLNSKFLHMNRVTTAAIPHPAGIYSSESNLSISSTVQDNEISSDQIFPCNICPNWQTQYSDSPLPYPSAAQLPPKSPCRNPTIRNGYSLDHNRITKCWGDGGNRPTLIADDAIQRTLALSSQNLNTSPWMLSSAEQRLKSNLKFPYRSTMELSRGAEDGRFSHGDSNDEYQRLLEISNAIKELEQQKRDIMSKLNREKCFYERAYDIGRNARSTLNLTSSNTLSSYNRKAALNFDDNHFGFQNSSHTEGSMHRVFPNEDDLLPITQVPLSAKLGSISRSHRRLAQSLVTFPPLLEDNDSIYDQDDDALFEHTNTVISHVLNDEDSAVFPVNELRPPGYATSNLKHARSLSAIQDELESSSLSALKSYEGDSVPTVMMSTRGLTQPPAPPATTSNYSITNLCSQVDQISSTATEFSQSSKT